MRLFPRSTTSTLGVAFALFALVPLLTALPAHAQVATFYAPTLSAGHRIAYLRPWPRLSHPTGWRRVSRGFRPQGSGSLRWNGGSVQHHPTQYLIFWGPAWVTTAGRLVPAAQLVQRYFLAMGGTAFARVLTQYADQSGAIANTDTLAAAVVDTAAPPTDTSCGGQTIQDTAIVQEIAHAAHTFNWPAPSQDATYLVYTPPHYAVNDGTGACSTQYFCAYHAWSGTTPGFAYAAIPYPDDSACQVARSPHHDVAGDSLASSSSHEQFEAITDPQVGAGWIDAANFEIADKCFSDFSRGYVRLRGGDRYELQSEYSNSTHACVTTYSPPRHTPARHRR